MGPANAENALREALSLGATRAVLLSNRLLAGSDTWATSNALAAAIGWFGDVDLVLCGISALDGETGQVGPEVATRLGWPQATGCESLEIDGTSLVARRIVEGGFERLRLPLPAVVTIAETAFAPRYPTMIGRRRPLTAVVAGHDLSPAVDEMVRHGVDVVFVADWERLALYRAEPHARIITQLAAARRPSALLFGATTTARDLAPRVGAILHTGLAADCTDLVVGPWERRGTHFDALVHQIRPAMTGGVLATCVCPEARPQMATVRPGVFELRPAPRQARIEAVPVVPEPNDLRSRGHRPGNERRRRRTFGRRRDHRGRAGCDASSWHLVATPTDTFGERVAASRGAVEAGLAPRALQAGQTGTTLHPRLYVACGISGALQHAVRMRTARTVLAINRDPDAFIFHLAHAGIVADVRDALPQLIAALRRARA
jgi:electron transfer flavoprotein alpha subunit